MPHLQPDIILHGRYRLLERLGLGGFSEVWKAEDTKAANLIKVVKIFAPERGLDAAGLEVFRREYQLTTNLNHPHLLLPEYFDVWEEAPYLVMRWCTRGSLRNRLIHEGPLPEREILLVMTQIAGAMDYLHSRTPPLMHRDVKPPNILMDQDGNYLLADFGISGPLRTAVSHSLGLSRFMTQEYAPPERFSDVSQSLPAGDIFSLGVTLYELATGDVPWMGQGGVALLGGAKVPWLPDAFGRDLRETIFCCMQADPAARPTAKDISIGTHHVLRPASKHRGGIAHAAFGVLGGILAAIATLTVTAFMLGIIGIDISNASWIQPASEIFIGLVMLLCGLYGYKRGWNFLGSQETHIARRSVRETEFMNPNSNEEN